MPLEESKRAAKRRKKAEREEQEAEATRQRQAKIETVIAEAKAEVQAELEQSYVIIADLQDLLKVCLHCRQPRPSPAVPWRWSRRAALDLRGCPS